LAPGKFITFEGGEGAGKSTQVKLLADALSQSGVSVCVTREPGGTPGGEEIRNLLVRGTAARWDAMTEALLHYAARREHLRSLILPQLAAGAWVISDRFADSTMAYQGYGHQLGREPIERLYALVVGDSHPDLTLILDVPVDVGLRRAAARQDSETRYEDLGHEFHERLRAGFHEIARREPQRCKIIDASGSPDEVHARVRTVVASSLGAAL
jgi:dTMP kinase